jgi:hypothetical protein
MIWQVRVNGGSVSEGAASDMGKILSLSGLRGMTTR